MSRVSKETKALQWTRRLERFHDSGLNAKQFCAREGVSLPSFYQWKKKLARHALRRSDSAPSLKPSPAFKPVEFATATSREPRCSTIRLDGGVVIELGDNLLIVDRVIQAVLKESARCQAIQTGTPPC